MEASDHPNSREPIVKILRGSVWLTATSMISKIFFLIFYIFLANRLEPAKLGRYEFLLGSAFIFFVATDLGLGFLLVQKISRRREQTGKLLAEFLGLRLMMLIPFTLFYILFFFFYGRYVKSIAWDWAQTLAVSYFVLHVVWDLFRSVLRGWERMDLEALSTLAERLLYMILGTLILLLGYRLTGMMFVAQLTIAFSFGLILYWIFKAGIRIQIRFRPDRWPTLLRETLPFGLGALCIVALYREDTLMLNWLKGDKETGLYSPAFRLMEGTLLIPQAVALAAYPTFSRIFHEGNHPVRLLAEKLQRWLLLFCLPLMVGGILLAPKVIELFSPKYLTSTPVLRILLLALPALYLNYLVGTLLRSIDRQSLNLISALFALITNFVLNLILIPRMGAEGAAIATVATQVVYCALLYYFLRRTLGGLRLHSYIFLLLVCSLVFAGILYPFRTFGLYFSVPLGVILFIGIAGLFRLIHRRDIEEFLDFIRAK